MRMIGLQVTKALVLYCCHRLSFSVPVQKLKSLPDPLEAVATQITRDMKLLCLDEFMVRLSSRA
jgi:predicted ATPase